MSKTPRIVVIGSAVMDLVTYAQSMPRAGETVLAPRFSLGFGGKGANQAVAARRMGAEVAMVACLGDDLFGPAALANFDAVGIDRTHVRTIHGTPTGTASIIVEPNGQNRILIVKGANDSLGPEDVDQAQELIRRADAVILQSEIALPTIYESLALTNRLGVLSLFNPAPAQPLDWESVPLADWLIPNEMEAEALTGIKVATIDDARACARRLRELGSRQVVITLGERGAWLSTPEIEEEVPPFPANARDTTGAGDAFIGCFAVSLASGLDPAEAVARANLYASLSTQSEGTQRSFIGRDAFEEAWSQQLAPH